MNEVWKPVNGYEGIYEVSNFGRVKSLERVIYYSNGRVSTWKEKMKALTINPDGYLTVKLSACGKDMRVPVHRVVYEAFCGEIPDGYEINHKDFDRKNNVPENLEIVTHIENIEYTVSAGRNAAATHDFSGKNNPNYGNRKLSRIYSENPELSKQAQGRPGLQNGRCRRVAAIFEDGTRMEFDYMTACAEYIINAGIAKTNINSAISSMIGAMKRNGRYHGIKIEYID